MTIPVKRIARKLALNTQKIIERNTGFSITYNKFTDDLDLYIQQYHRKV